MNAKSHMVKENAYPYSVGNYQTRAGLESIVKLFELLPHGSGINGMWGIKELRHSRFMCQNSFEAMNESGIYCHEYPFKITVRHSQELTQECHLCKGNGVRQLSELAIARGDTLKKCQVFLESMGVTVFGCEEYEQFICNLCHGTGTRKVPEFIIEKITWSGVPEYTCCGIGLHEYLSDLFFEALNPENWENS